MAVTPHTTTVGRRTGSARRGVWTIQSNVTNSAVGIATA